MTREITIQNVGAIHNLTIPVPDGGGVVVLEGDNGVGKSEALRAVGSLIDGDGPLEPRHGTLAGEVDGLGCSIRVGRRTTRSGEVVVRGLDGGDPSNFVDPQIADPERADVERVRELFRLARITIPETAWEELAGGADQLTAIARPKTLAEKDPAARASLLKSDFDKAALEAERECDNWAARANAKLESIKGIDLGAPCDAAVLRAEEDAASRAEMALETQVKSAAAAKSAAEKASADLANARAAYQGPTIEQADAAQREAQSDIETANAKVREAEIALERARGDARTATLKSADAGRAVRAAREHADAIAGWEKSIEAAQEARPTPSAEDLAAAAARLAEAHRAAEIGVVVRRAIDEKRLADEACAKAAEFKALAHRLRERGKACEGVLTDAISRIAPRGLRWQNGRLVVDKDGREEFFGKLSDGERWRVGFDIAVDAGGPGAVIPIRQSAWQDLDPKGKQARAEHARERGVVVITAECTRGGELRASVFNAEAAEAVA